MLVNPLDFVDFLVKMSGHFIHLFLYVYASADHVFDLILSPGAPEFVSAGLYAESVVRLGFVGVVPVRSMTRRLGRLSPNTLAGLQKRLANHIFPGQ